ncbi:VWA domain-containing protein [Subsaxibacter sp. CAU 1640]|uniref:VWA domain-containing protein n=1 Tax=Subsaxibacter sp. CAU 1640 TaxID=2933271 RepID=UPI002004F3D2|nr:VWA domain-containing protein [Subsaxibacter sp. CAU 1640]MCK7591010.1 VWA domain-containing protein [Subsaxibacter sp. CAU 1640]
MQKETVLYIILAGIIALSLALFQYIYKSKKRSTIYMLLAFLRFVTIFSVLLLLINPKFDKITYYNEKPNLVIAVDNSESISYLKQDSKVKTLLQNLRSNDQLNERFNLEVYTFGKEVNANDSLTFNEKQSNPSLLFERLSQVFANSTSPTLLVSDGNQTYGNDYEYATSKFKQPIFPVILGDTTQYLDLKIQQLNVNKYAYLKNKFPVEIITVYSGTENVNSELRVSSGNATVYSEKVNFSKENASKVFNLTLPADRVGVSSYKAEIVAIESEKNIANNVKNFAVEVIDQKTSVAIVSDVLHPDLGALKKSIESNEQRQATILKPNDFLNQSNDFQLVILYQPNNNFKTVYEEVEKLRLNKFTIVGAQTNWSALNGFQNLYTQTITNQTEEFQPILNINYSPFIIDDLDFSDFPPLKSEFGVTKFKVPTETILFKSVNGTQLNEPLLLSFEANDRREALLLGEGIWRWRAQTYLDTKSFASFDDFMGKLVQYLSSNQKKTRLNVVYESFYNGNDDVQISAQYFNKNYEFDKSATLNITLKNKETEATRTFPFILKNNSYEVDLSGLPSGDYAFTVSVKNENVSNSGEIKILDYNVEQQFLNANVTKLQSLATNSQGKPYFINESDDIINELISDERFVTIQKSSKNVVPLIDWKFLLAVIVLCLSLEWFIRKYNGLI